MEHFIYQHGDRPLEGYTIQRAAGRGGFGEVYYATSDSGREVALKAVNNYETIELRGITQCMNLKSPHLVSIFDVKYNDANKPFVVMEFVSGPSLRDLIDQSPNGLGEQKSAFFLREIAKGLSYLHECGIVHRDLKPGNIFYENGYVKIGDYGLSKAIKHGYNSNQTITVGTVHYMAPEIGAGNYDSSIDIYALGCMLYEMLTGNVPYFGSSPGEVLMKHVSSEPDLTDIDPTFARVIKKALAKDPIERYKSVQEMVEDAFGQEHIKNSVSQFRADDLSMIAGQVAQKIKEKQTQQTRQAPAHPAAPEPKAVPQQQSHEPAAQPQPEVFNPEKNYRLKLKKYDKFSPVGRIIASLIPIILLTLAFAFAISGIDLDRYGIGGEKEALTIFLALMQLGAVIGVFTGNRLIASKTSDPVLINFARIVPAILLANLFAFPAYVDHSGTLGPLIGIPSCALIMLGLMEKHKWLSPMRKRQIEIGHTVGMCVFLFFLSIFIPRMMGLNFSQFQLYYAICLLAGVSLSCQMLVPFIEPVDRKAFNEDDTNYFNVSKKSLQRDSQGQILQPDWLKATWRIICALLLTLAAFTGVIIAENTGDTEAMGAALLAGTLLLFLSSLKYAFRKYYFGLGKSLIKPVLRIITFSIGYVGFSGMFIFHEGAFSLLAFPGMVLFWVVVFIPARVFDTAAEKSGQLFGNVKAAEQNAYPASGFVPKPDWLRAVWFAVSCTLFVLMVSFYIGIAFSGEEEMCISLGIAANLLFFYSLIPTLSGTYKGLGKSLIKPAALMILYALAHLGYTVVAVEDVEEMTALAVPATILFWVVLFIPGRVFDTAAEKSARFAQSAFRSDRVAQSSNISPLKRGVALLLVILPVTPFVPLCGMHRIYAGRIGSGILWLFTAGLLGIGQLVDFIMILTGSFTDKNDKPLLVWWNEGVKPEYEQKAAQNKRPSYQKEDNDMFNDMKSAVMDVKDSVVSIAASAKEKAATVKKTVTDPEFIEERKRNGEHFSRGSNYSVYREPIRPGAALLRVVGFIFLLISTIAGLLWAIRISTILKVIPEISSEITGEFSPHVWMMFDRVIVIIMMTALLISMLFTSLGRKHNGGSHIIRGVISIAMVAFVANFWHDWTGFRLNKLIEEFTPSNQAAMDVLNLVLESLPQSGDLIFALLMAAASIVLFAWPAKKQTPQQFDNIFRNDQPQQGYGN